MSNHRSTLADVIRLVYQIPGLHLRQLQRLLGVSFSSTRYNVEKLSKRGSIVSKKDGGHVRLYPPGMTPHEIAAYSQLRSDTNKAILGALSNGSTLSNKEITLATKLAKSTVSEALHRLVHLGLVRTLIDDSLKRAYVLSPSLKLAKMETDAMTLPYSAVDRFMDLWDF